MIDAILKFVGGIVQSVLNVIGPLLGPGQNWIPTVDCLFDQLGLRSSFMNFSCSVNLTTAELSKVSLYVTCILSSLTNNLFNTSLLNSANPSCASVDFTSIGLLLAKCEWCRTSGCYQVGGKFITTCNPISLPPQPDSCLGIHLLLYTQSNPYPNPQEISADLSNIASSNFNFNENTTFLIPGWGGGIQPLDSEIVPATLNCTNQNVIVFNWSKGAATLYNQASANARVAGKIIANFVKVLNDTFNYPPSKIHLIGHSLGSQVAGFAGAAYPGIGRITGLDPAGPDFDCDPTIRLDPTDALLVDVIHTEGGIFGSVNNLGDVDFWPNGGITQPGCESSINLYPYTGIDNNFGCNHGLVVYYYASSMRFCQSSFNCSFAANMCSNYSDFQAGKCNTNCNADGSKCATMGYLAQNYKWAGYPLPAPQPFYLNVPKEAPYCLKQTN